MITNDNHGDGIGGEEEMADPAGDLSDPMSTSFSSQQIHLFTTRYENGYDIYTDAEYMIWLAETHPDAHQITLILRTMFHNNVPILFNHFKRMIQLATE